MSHLAQVIEQIEQTTNFETKREFQFNLQLFRDRSISFHEFKATVSQLLSMYPQLQQDFEQASDQMMVSSALQYVNKVRLHFYNDSKKYEQFLVILKEFQRGMHSLEETTAKVEDLLGDSQELVTEFKQFYEQSELQKSQQTLNESTPLLGRDIESLEKRKSYSRYYVAGLLVSILGGGGIATFLYLY